MQNALSHLDSNNTMLIDGLPHAVEQADGKRHPFQEEILNFVRSNLEEGRRRAAELQDTANNNTQSAREELTVIQASCESAATAEKNAVTFRDEQATRLSEAYEETAKNEAEENRARAVSDAAKKKMEQASQDKASTAALVEGPLRMLLDAGWEEPEIRDSSITLVQQYLEAADGVEKALIASLSGAFKRRIDERGEFDKVALDALSEVIKARTAFIDEELSKCTAVYDEESNLALGAWAMLDVAKSKEKAIAEEVAQAEAALSAASQHYLDEQIRVASQEKVIEEHLASGLNADLQVTKLEKSLTALDELIAGVPEEAAASEDVVMKGADEVSEERERVLQVATPMVA